MSKSKFGANKFGLIRTKRPPINTGALQDAFHYAAAAQQRANPTAWRSSAYSTFADDGHYKDVTASEFIHSAQEALRKAGLHVPDHVKNPVILRQMAERAGRAFGWDVANDRPLGEE